MMAGNANDQQRFGNFMKTINLMSIVIVGDTAKPEWICCEFTQRGGIQRPFCPFGAGRAKCVWGQPWSLDQTGDLGWQYCQDRIC